MFPKPQFRDIPLHPPQNGLMGQGDAASRHHLDEIAGAQLKRQIPPHAQHDDFVVKMTALEKFPCRSRFRHPDDYRGIRILSTLSTRTGVGHVKLGDGPGGAQEPRIGSYIVFAAFLTPLNKAPIRYKSRGISLVQPWEELTNFLIRPI
jgi:hypothetical protein